MEHLCQRLRQAREEAHLSQAAVAKSLKMHRPTISQIEAGRRAVKVAELVAFARLYRVSLDWLAGIEQQGRVGSLAQRIEALPSTQRKVIALMLNELLKTKNKSL